MARECRQIRHPRVYRLRVRYLRMIPSFCERGRTVLTVQLLDCSSNQSAIRPMGNGRERNVFYPTTSSARPSAPMLPERKAWIFASELNTRLDELLTLLGCPHNIAPVDPNSLGKKIVEITTHAMHLEACNSDRRISHR